MRRNPISFLVEQAGGRATDGNTDIKHQTRFFASKSTIDFWV